MTSRITLTDYFTIVKTISERIEHYGFGLLSERKVAEEFGISRKSAANILKAMTESGFIAVDDVRETYNRSQGTRYSKPNYSHKKNSDCGSIKVDTETASASLSHSFCPKSALMVAASSLTSTRNDPYKHTYNLPEEQITKRDDYLDVSNRGITRELEDQSFLALCKFKNSLAAAVEDAVSRITQKVAEIAPNRPCEEKEAQKDKSATPDKVSTETKENASKQICKLPKYDGQLGKSHIEVEDGIEYRVFDEINTSPVEGEIKLLRVPAHINDLSKAMDMTTPEFKRTANTIDTLFAHLRIDDERMQAADGKFPKRKWNVASISGVLAFGHLLGLPRFTMDEIRGLAEYLETEMKHRRDRRAAFEEYNKSDDTYSAKRAYELRRVMNGEKALWIILAGCVKERFNKSGIECPAIPKTQKERNNTLISKEEVAARLRTGSVR